MSQFIVIATILTCALFHELGHLIAGAMVGIKSNSIGLGLPFGPMVTLKLKSGFRLNISPILLAAYVQPDEDSLSQASWSKKSFMLLGGVMGNYVYMYVVMFLAYLHINGVKALSVIPGKVFLHTLDSLKAVISSINPSELGSFVGAIASAPAAQQAVITMDRPGLSPEFALYFLCLQMFSWSFILLNLLPIPGLDGGQILTSFCVQILKVSEKRVNLVSFFFFGVIMVFSAGLIGKDLLALILKR